MAERKPVQARLSEEAWIAWNRLCTSRELSFSSIIEAIGLDLAGGGSPLPDRVFTLAAEIAELRGSRRRRRRPP